MEGEGNDKTCAIIVAAGKGSRMNSETSKQFMDICGIPVLARSLIVLSSCASIDGIILVVNEKDVEFCREQIVEKFNIRKVIEITAGGETRARSVYNGLKKAGEEYGYVAIHDGARPLITALQVEECIEAAKKYGAACIAVKATDTLKTSENGVFFGGSVNRDKVWKVQTPQAFKRSLIVEAYENAISKDLAATDDTAIVEMTGTKVRIVPGSVTNIKITTMEDLTIARAIAKN